MDVIEQLVVFVAWYSERMGIPMVLAIERLKAIYHEEPEQLLPLVAEFKQQ